MKRQLIDYSGFTLKRLNEPRFSHLKLLAGWIFYFAMYFITENLIPAENCHPMYCALDDRIPFNEVFVIFYVGWYFLVVAALLYTMLTSVKNFSRVQTYILITQVFACEKNLCHSVVILRELPVIHIHQLTLAYGRGGLLCRHVGRLSFQIQLADAHSDGSGRNQNHFMPGVYNITEHFAKLFHMADIQVA